MADGKAGERAPRTSSYSTPGEGRSSTLQRRHDRRALRAVVAGEPSPLGAAAVPADAGDGVHAPLRVGDGPADRRAARHALRLVDVPRVQRVSSLACVTAIPIGIAMGVSRIARGIFDPPIEFYRPLPPLAYLPLIVIWFGIDELSKVLLIYLACFAPDGDERAGRRALRVAGADPRRVLDGRVEVAGDPARRDSGGDAGDPDVDAHRDRVRLDDARRGRNGRRDARPRDRWCSTRRTSCAPTS